MKAWLLLFYLLLCSAAGVAFAASCEDALFAPEYGVFADEGGYQNSKNDAGNWSGRRVGAGKMCGGTKYGIACAYHPNIDIKNLTKAGAAEIYSKNECKAIRIDELKGKRDPAMLLGLAVNQGAGTAIKNLKEARNAIRRIDHLPPVPVDTRMDDATVQWFNEFTRDDHDRLLLLFAMSLLGIDRATDIVDANPRQAGNLMGWVERWNPLNYK